MFDTVLVAGLGLMGGSMAKTIKARTLSRVLGWNRTRATAEQALADGSIDAIATDALFREVDLVIIGLYPQATVDWLLENMPKMKKGCVIVDMVGVKQFMVDHLEQAALDAGVHYVGGHPMAGREFSGLDYALPTLFDGASMIFVPTRSSNERVLEQLEAYFMSLGFGQTVRCTAQQHDHNNGRDRGNGGLRADTRAKIRGEPRQRGRPEMDRQRHRGGENPAQAVDQLGFPVLFGDVRVQRFHQEIIEEGPDRAQPDDGTGRHRP